MPSDAAIAIRRMLLFIFLCFFRPNCNDAGLATQAATLCFGLIKNHPWVGGNKRTATHLTDHFLRMNGREIVAASADVIEMVNGVESGEIDLPRLVEWMNEHVRGT